MLLLTSSGLPPEEAPIMIAEKHHFLVSFLLTFRTILSVSNSRMLSCSLSVSCLFIQTHFFRAVVELHLQGGNR